MNTTFLSPVDFSVSFDLTEIVPTAILLDQLADLRCSDWVDELEETVDQLVEELYARTGVDLTRH